MKCNKVVYRSRPEAKKAMKELNKIHHFGSITLKGVYICEQCNGYHLTSMGKQQSRDFERHQRNKNKK